MKERQILFSAEMVRAILDGRKTQTRRVMKGQPYTLRTEGWGFPTRKGGFVSQNMIVEDCPYGVPGDRLYVKEATWLWCERRPNGTTKTGRQKWHYVPVLNTPPVYVADHPTKPDWGYPVTTRAGNVQMWKYKTARFMPRWASRITLEITDVRVQRLQEISHEDARAEGVYAAPHRGPQNTPEQAAQYGGCLWNTGIEQCFGCSFMLLWNQINGPRGFGWYKNPWVWVISFKRVNDSATNAA